VVVFNSEVHEEVGWLTFNMTGMLHTAGGESRLHLDSYWPGRGWELQQSSTSTAQCSRPAPDCECSWFMYARSFKGCVVEKGAVSNYTDVIVSPFIKLVFSS
jgi:hypothetical protein